MVVLDYIARVEKFMCCISLKSNYKRIVGRYIKKDKCNSRYVKVIIWLTYLLTYKKIKLENKWYKSIIIIYLVQI